MKWNTSLSKMTVGLFSVIIVGGLVWGVHYLYTFQADETPGILGARTREGRNTPAPTFHESTEDILSKPEGRPLPVEGMSSLLFQEGVHSFSKFPDSLDRSLTQDKDWLIKQWGCPSADVFSFQSGPQLALCGTLAAAPSHPGTYAIKVGEMNDFSWLITKDKKGVTRLLNIGGGWGGNPEWLEPKEGKKFLYVEGIKTPSRYCAIFQRTISCPEDSCAISKETCAIDIPKDIDSDVVQRIHMEKPNGSHSQEFLTGYADQLLLRALINDPQATHLLFDFPFDLDGAAGEHVEADRGTYKRAKELGCLAEDARRQ